MKRAILSFAISVCMIATLMPLTTESASALTAPSITSVYQTDLEQRCVKVEWENYEGGDNYSIELQEMNSGRTWKMAWSVDYYYIQNLSVGQTLRLRVRLTNGGSVYSAWSPVWTIKVQSGYGYGNYGKKESTGLKTVTLNKWSAMKYKYRDGRLTYKIVVPRAGWIRPMILVDEERVNKNGAYPNASDLISAAVVTSASGKTIYSGIDWNAWDKYSYYEDYNGHQWTRGYLEKMRLPKGTYYLRFKNDTYCYGWGYFKFKVQYKSETGNTTVEKEFNNSRKTANAIKLNKKYHGNIGMNGNDKDYFKFTVGKKTKVSTYLWVPEGQIIDQGRYWNGMELLSAGGSQLGDAEYLRQVEGSNGKIWEKYYITKTLKKGTYYVKIANHNYCHNYYFMIKKR